MDSLAVVVTTTVPAEEPGSATDTLEDTLAQYASQLRSVPGFMRSEVHRARTGPYQVKTWWRTAEDYEAWSSMAESAGADDGSPAELLVQLSDVIASSDLDPAKAVPRILSAQTLAQYRGQAGGRIYVGVLGKVYDVSASAGFYGPGGQYHVFAGRDATRALAKGLLLDEEVLNRPGDVSDLDGSEQLKLDSWVDRFEAKYPCVAFLDAAAAAAAAAAASATLATSADASTRKQPKKQPRARVVRRKVQVAKAKL